MALFRRKELVDVPAATARVEIAAEARVTVGGAATRLQLAHDPKRGWIIPLTAAAASDVVEQVRQGAGAYEIAGLNLGIVVE